MAAPTPSSINPAITKALSSITASPRVRDALTKLHTEALAEEPLVSTDVKPTEQQDRREALQRRALSLFVALDPDKCALVYLLLRAAGARHVVEAGTSFGVSTIWLALAVGQNVGASGGEGRVIATENEAAKAERARENWRLAGEEEVGRWIDLREGDLLETLREDMPSEVDFLLLDIWTPLALPTLKIVRPHLRKGALIAVDNIDAAKGGYGEFLEYVGQSENGFKGTVAPYGGGLQLLVYLGD